MCEKIVEDIKSFAEPNFAEWLKPFLSISDDSKEEVIGVRVPILRKLAKKYKDIDLITLEKLLTNNIHESRALAVFIMILKSKKEPDAICKMYLENLEYINNWDLIDYSASHIVAPNVDEKCLRKLAKSDYLWANRVAMSESLNIFILLLNFIPVITAIGSAFVAMWNDSDEENASKGAMDNATGCALSYAVIKYFKETYGMLIYNNIENK